MTYIATHTKKHTHSVTPSAMGKSGLLSLLPLVLLVIGYSLPPSLAECIFTNSTNVYEGEKVVSVGRPESGNVVYLKSSVQLSRGFESVKLTATAEAEIDGSEQTVLLTHLIKPDDECFVADQWMKVDMWADLEEFSSLGFRVGKCWKECMADFGPTKLEKLTLQWLNVTATGRSEWTEETPSKGCTGQLSHTNRPSNAPNCSIQILKRPTSSPHARTSTQLSSPPSVVVVVIVVVVSLAVVTGAILGLMDVCCWKKRKNSTVTGEFCWLGVSVEKSILWLIQGLIKRRIRALWV